MYKKIRNHDCKWKQNHGICDFTKNVKKKNQKKSVHPNKYKGINMN